MEEKRKLAEEESPEVIRGRPTLDGLPAQSITALTSHLPKELDLSNSKEKRKKERKKACEKIHK